MCSVSYSLKFKRKCSGVSYNLQVQHSEEVSVSILLHGVSCFQPCIFRNSFPGSLFRENGLEKTSKNTANLKHILMNFLCEAAACCLCVCRVKQRSEENKMVTILALADEERLTEKVKMYPSPCLYNKKTKGYKEKDVLSRIHGMLLASRTQNVLHAFFLANSSFVPFFS